MALGPNQTFQDVVTSEVELGECHGVQHSLISHYVEYFLLVVLLEPSPSLVHVLAVDKLCPPRPVDAVEAIESATDCGEVDILGWWAL